MTQHPLNLLMVSSEAVPYAKTGGLADVAGALPLELAKLGHDVILLLPHYRCISESGRSLPFRLSDTGADPSGACRHAD